MTEDRYLMSVREFYPSVCPLRSFHLPIPVFLPLAVSPHDDRIFFRNTAGLLSPHRL